MRSLRDVISNYFRERIDEHLKPEVEGAELEWIIDDLCEQIGKHIKQDLGI